MTSLPTLILAAAAALAGQTPAVPAKPAPSPGEIVAAAPAAAWVAIAPDDLLVMELAPDAVGRPRRVLIQLMAAPFSAGWIANIRTLARAHWWDGLAVVRVQDNYVAQWGDPDGETPGKAKPLPAGLRTVNEDAYTLRQSVRNICDRDVCLPAPQAVNTWSQNVSFDAYGARVGWASGFPVGFDASLGQNTGHVWPVHCYGVVGVGRNLSPDTGTGAELYAVIGHAPRHLDRNIALVGRVVEGIEHLSSLPRGTGALGFYATPAERTVIHSVRLASELPVAERPRLQYLSTESASFAAYADARANRRDPFFITPAGGADICNIPVPIRRAP